MPRKPSEQDPAVEETPGAPPPEGEETPAADPPVWEQHGFKDADAFAKSYGELKKTFDRQANEVGELRTELEELSGLLQAQQEQRQTAGQQTEWDALSTQYADALEQGDYARALALQASLTQAQIQQAVAPFSKPPEQDIPMLSDLAENNLRRKYGDEFDVLYADTASVLEQNPYLLPDLNKPVTQAEIERGIESAFKIARGDSYAKQRTAEQQQAEQAAAQERMKREAQTVHESGPRPLPPSEQQKAWDEIRGANTGAFRVPHS